MLLNFGPSYLGLADLFYSSFDQDQMFMKGSILNCALLYDKPFLIKLHLEALSKYPRICRIRSTAPK